ncbi:preprotein translocase, YajC subunit [Ammonifex degensii KC4]|uniref:Preprotein translocase, YajC subunit n=1 Tax=Ammonifex degensii (strain DSM 10501 / KC4) TaxID=429009 RepID=C9R7V5_AMMDK|nr:preprotein translocase subunit YajC [Ammonifex degensii]ACX52384.1 preprotein translocase, YajC subunit [Ammonifex degensii KC4]
MVSQQLVSILWLVAIIALFYFLLIRPQQVRQRKHQEMLKALKVDDRVVTIGGIIGTIAKIKEDTVILRVADNVRIEILKQAIAQVLSQAEEGERK